MLNLLAARKLPARPDWPHLYATPLPDCLFCQRRTRKLDSDSRPRNASVLACGIDSGGAQPNRGDGLWETGG